MDDQCDGEEDDEDGIGRDGGPILIHAAGDVTGCDCAGFLGAIAHEVGHVAFEWRERRLDAKTEDREGEAKEGKWAGSRRLRCRCRAPGPRYYIRKGKPRHDPGRRCRWVRARSHPDHGLRAVRTARPLDSTRGVSKCDASALSNPRFEPVYPYHGTSRMRDVDLVTLDVRRGPS